MLCCCDYLSMSSCIGKSGSDGCFWYCNSFVINLCGTYNSLKLICSYVTCHVSNHSVILPMALWSKLRDFCKIANWFDYWIECHRQMRFHGIGDRFPMIFSFSHAKVLPCFQQLSLVNSLWPSDAIWQHRSVSTLAQVMACCLPPPSHYLNQCWLFISELL